jgi:putative transposase
LQSRIPVQVALPTTINGRWSIDFMSDSLFSGRRFRTFNVVDDFSRDALSTKVDIGLPAD